jgi:hypothetical protein
MGKYPFSQVGLESTAENLFTGLEVQLMAWELLNSCSIIRQVIMLGWFTK